MARKDALRIREEVAVAATGTGTIRTEPVPAGEIWCVQSLAYRNVTGTRGAATFIVDRDGVQHVLRYEGTVTQSAWYNYAEQQYLYPGERVQVEQATCTAADKLHLHIMGYILFTKDMK